MSDLLFWLPLLLIAAIIIIRWRAAITRYDQGLAALTPAPTCQVRTCTNPAHTVFDRHPSGAIRLCEAHAARIRPERVYDQEIAAIEDWANGGRPS